MDASNLEPGDLERELRALGKNLGDVFRVAWASEDRQRVQREIGSGLADIAAALRSAADDFESSDAGRQLKQEVRELEDRIHSGELESKVRDELLNVLRTVNTELDRAGQAMSGRAPSAKPPEEDPG